jgi:2-keto-4-pentenoate hydratase/2-oxohepta-3-ene-1,7-dioic acid hydratase in catechol pathway
MKLCRTGPVGHEIPCLVDDGGMLRDLSNHVADIDAAALSPSGLARIAALDPATLPAIEGTPRYGVPVAGTRKFVAIGLNYADHAAESNLPIPDEPVVFNKWVSCLQGPDDPVTIPRGSAKTDWRWNWAW